MKSLSLAAKLNFIFAVFVVACASISFIGITRMSTIKEGLDQIVNENAVVLQNAQKLQGLYNTQLINEKNFILSNEESEYKVHRDYMIKRNKEIQESMDVITKTTKNPETIKDLDQFKGLSVQWLMLMDEIEEYKRAGDVDKAISLSKVEGRELRLKVEGLLDGIVQRTVATMSADVKKADENYSHARMLLILVSVGATAIGLGLAMVTLSKTKKNVDRAIADLAENSVQVSSAAHQISAASVELSTAASEQASSLQETASSIEELNSMVKRNADNAKDAASLAEESSQSATRGREVVDDMITAIDDINSSNERIVESINESNKKISEIVEVISEIGGKTKIINDIVFQTKLLAFNASVEAARAGEHGKGFAVVAEEVGSLAQVSGNASGEISSLLENSITKVETIVSETKANVEKLVIEGKNKVDAGTKVAQQCGVVLDEIVQNVNKVTQMASEISSASQEQSLGVQEITKAMNMLDDVTQTNANTSEESASAAKLLSQQSESLEHVVHILTASLQGENYNKGQESSPKGPVSAPSSIPEARAEKPESSAAEEQTDPRDQKVLSMNEHRPAPSSSEDVQWESLDGEQEQDDDEFQVI